MWIQLISVIRKRYILLFITMLCLLQAALPRGVAPVDLTVQLVPPYSSRIVDYVAPGIEKLRIIALQRDLTQASYRFFLRMEVSVNGQVLFRTSSNWLPPATTIAPGMPVILGGADLQPYFDANHLDFVHFNRDQYIANPNLPEGYTSICFTAYDYGRPDVAVSETNCGNYFLTLPEPPLLNYPACGMQVPALVPQQLSFSWMPMNMGNTASQSTAYELSLYENRDHRNPNDIVQSLAPIYKNRSQAAGTLIYGPGEPALQPGMNYVWRVQAIDENGRQAFKNNGFSLPCEFTYTADSGYNWANAQPLQIYAKAMNETNAKIGWLPDKVVAYDSYTVYYRKKSNSNNWFNNTLTDTTYFLSGLEPGTTYETRVQGIKGSSTGVYSSVVDFTTPAKKVVDCKQAAGILATYNGRPYLTAMRNDIVHYGSFDLTIDNVQALQPGYYRGTGTVTVPFMANMTLSVTFTSIQIDDEMQVTAGEVEFDSKGVDAWLASTPTVNTVIKNLSDAISALIKTNVADDSDVIKKYTNALVAAAENELPANVSDSLAQAVNDLLAGKRDYDAASQAYDKATTQEEKEDAAEMMEDAKTRYEQAKDKIGEIETAKSTLLAKYAGIVRKALQSIFVEQEKNIDSTKTMLDQTQRSLDDMQDNSADTTFMDDMIVLSTVDFDQATSMTADDKAKVKDYLGKEFQYNRAVMARIFSSIQDSDENAAKLAADLKKNDVSLVRYIDEQLKKGTLENDLIKDVKEVIYKRIEKIVYDKIYQTK